MYSNCIWHGPCCDYPIGCALTQNSAASGYLWYCLYDYSTVVLTEHQLVRDRETDDTQLTHILH